MSTKIICAGEALIDMLPRIDDTGMAVYAPHSGGSVYNTAIALGRLQVPVALVSGISTDLFGTQLKTGLAASHVQTDLLIRTDRPTTLAFVWLNNGNAHYTFYDENTAGRMLNANDMPPLPETAKALFLGGISLVVEPCAAAYEALALRERHRLIMVDPNIRTSFIHDEAAYRARLDRIFAVADIVKVSDADLAWIAGSDDIESGARKILERGPKVVFITLGSEGAMAVTRTDTVTVAATRVEVVDSVGAGDTFNAGVLAMLEQSGVFDKDAVTDPDLLLNCLRMGTATAAITVGRAGANPPWHYELDI